MKKTTDKYYILEKILAWLSGGKNFRGDVQEKNMSLESEKTYWPGKKGERDESMPWNIYKNVIIILIRKF